MVQKTNRRSIKVGKGGRRGGQNQRFEDAILLGFEDARRGHETMNAGLQKLEKARKRIP